MWCKFMSVRATAVDISIPTVVLQAKPLKYADLVQPPLVLTAVDEDGELFELSEVPLNSC